VVAADRKPWFDRLFTMYLERLTRKHFSHFYLVGDFPDVPDGVSVTFTPNHFSWWDGFLIQKIQREFLPRKQFHILMLANQLKVYKFFKWMGAYGIDLDDTKSIIKTVKYTRELLSNSANLTVIYPQGEIRPYDERPVEMKGGISRFVGGLGDRSVVIPVAFKAQYEEVKLPALYCSVGEPLSAGTVEKNFGLFQEKFVANLEKLDAAAWKKEFTRDLFK